MQDVKSEKPAQQEEVLKLFPEKKAAPAQDPAADAVQAQATPHEKHRTVGNKIYDWGVYSTFAWAGVAAVSALSAHEAMHGKHPAFNWLRSLNNNCISGLSKGLESTIMKGASKESIHGWAKGSTMFVTLGLGGWAMMAPIKWLEDHRERNAARIDNFLGTTPPDPKLVEAEVPQTWGSVLKGRLMSWGLSYAAFAAMGPKTTGHVSDWFANKASKVFMALKPSANQAKVKKWADIAAFDAVFTIITAAATYGFSRMFANLRKLTDPGELGRLMNQVDAAETICETLRNRVKALL
ncbi:MAG: hypothetical protein EBV03_10655, partial [Proteobacteria bacterium]|nr:hypothetical protein [Pseudomonadota bacterium]